LGKAFSPELNFLTNTTVLAALYSMSMSIYLAHYRTVFLMLSVHRVLLEQMCLKFAIEAGDAEIWIARMIAKCIPDGRTNNGERTTRAVFLARRASKQ